MTNSSMPYIKLYTEILDDHKLGRLTATQKWHFVSLLLLAGKCNAEGYFVSGQHSMDTTDIAWRLRDDPVIIAEDIDTLSGAGLVAQDPDGSWFVTDFYKYKYDCRALAEWKTIRLDVLERDGYVCQYCGEEANQVDHIVPVCQGGENDMDNLVAACVSCNCSKSGRTPEQAGMKLR